MRSDSERDGIKREHVIFTQAAVDHWELITSMWVLQPVKFGVGGGGGSWLRPWFPPVLLPFLFLQLTFVFDHFLLDFQWCESFIKMTIWTTPKNQTALLKSSTLDHVDIYLWQPKISSGWQVEVLEQQSSSTHLPPTRPLPP